MKLYVISGVAGMTGNELVRQILLEGDFVIGFDNFFASSVETIEDCLENEHFEFYEYDLNDAGDMEKIEQHVQKKKKNVEEVIYINCAAVVHTEYFYHVEATFQTNVNGMKAFLEQAIRVKADKFLNCSTSEVYSMNSWNEEGGVREDAYLSMATAEHSERTSYAVGKLLTEFFILDAVREKKIKGCSMRFANVYSRNERFPKHIIPHIIISLRDTGGVVLLENSKENCRTFLNNYDSCSAVLKLAQTETALDGTVYNVATDEEISILELVHLCAEKMGISNPKIRFEGYRKADPKRRILSTEKLKSRTDWKPQVGLNQGLEMCIRNYLGKKG